MSPLLLLLASLAGLGPLSVAGAAWDVAAPLQASCSDDAPPLSLMQRGALLGGRRTAGAAPAATARRSPAQKQCVLIASVAEHAAALMTSNAARLGQECDFILGHYDKKPEAFEKQPWYAELVVVAKSQPFKNKLDLLREVVAHDQDVLSRYEAVLLVDDDMDLSLLDMGCFASWFLASPYLVASPYSPSKDHYVTWNESSCPVRVTDQVTPTILLVKTSSIARLSSLILPQTIGTDGLVECDFGTVLGLCRWVADKPVYDPQSKMTTSDACAYVDKCGAALHTNIKSKRDEDHWNTCLRNTGLYMSLRMPYIAGASERCEDPSLPIYLQR